ncbi:hypothetical protein PORCRE_2033 [Porphyromonas crevioricanis JCM 15906]|uniref:Uncharacterized protein n=1 Tax=Porphyromonas crevioricanis JCM 15906 TaxID=1305617 RepID=T1CR36_9PORP|nr:hypothetical protein PORCRE_2033 [Porphyromonas crevioricanis JCM 15906]GAD06723.1 hypothetical protein PORCAN_324 [Porphyromonas crevioricanis JCM 13913]
MIFFVVTSFCDIDYSMDKIQMRSYDREKIRSFYLFGY